MADSIRRRYAVPAVARIETRDDGSIVRTVLSTTKKKKRVSKRYRGLDKIVRRVSRANKIGSTEFLARHERANRKKKNGGLRIVTKNLRKSASKGLKKLRLV